MRNRRLRRSLAAAAALTAGLAMTVTGGGRADAATTHSPGYWLVAADGGVFSYNAPYYGSAGGLHLAAPVVGMAVDGKNDGYWLLGRDGGIFNYGGAPFLGSAVGELGGSPAVGIGEIADGYIVVAANGTTVNFQPGQGPIVSSAPTGLDGPVVGIGTSPGINGGWDLVTAKGQVVPVGGGVGNLGDASGLKLTKPVVGISLGGANGSQYDLAAADGGVFAYGLPYSGSAAGERLAAPVVGVAVNSIGYYLVAADGGIFAYGGAGFLGSAANLHLAKPVVGMATY